jgi:hypothetical protein
MPASGRWIEPTRGRPTRRVLLLYPRMAPPAARAVCGASPARPGGEIRVAIADRDEALRDARDAIGAGFVRSHRDNYTAGYQWRSSSSGSCIELWGSSAVHLTYRQALPSSPSSMRMFRRLNDHGTCSVRGARTAPGGAQEVLEPTVVRTQRGGSTPACSKRHSTTAATTASHPGGKNLGGRAASDGRASAGVEAKSLLSCSTARYARSTSFTASASTTASLASKTELRSWRVTRAR